jgi:hypothetical protein
LLAGVELSLDTLDVDMERESGAKPPHCQSFSVHERIESVQRRRKEAKKMLSRKLLFQL